MIPGEVVWFDVIVPVGLVAEIADVAGLDGVARRRSARCAGSVGAAATVHDGGLVSTAWSKLVCFDGVGPGEVLVDRSGDRDAKSGDGAATVLATGGEAGRDQSAQDADGRTVPGVLAHELRPGGLAGLLMPAHRPPLDALRPVATLVAPAPRRPAADDRRTPPHRPQPLPPVCRRRSCTRVDARTGLSVRCRRAAASIAIACGRTIGERGDRSLSHRHRSCVRGRTGDSGNEWGRMVDNGGVWGKNGDRREGSRLPARQRSRDRSQKERGRGRVCRGLRATARRTGTGGTALVVPDRPR